MKESETVSFKVERSFEPCLYLQESPTLKNFEINTKYNKAFSSDFINFQFGEPQFRELLEYHTIAEFNKVRGKDFISFASFHGVYTEAYKKHPFIPNYTKLLVEKLKTGNANKANVIIVSGIPGSGKSKLTESLAKLLSAEGLPAVAFKPSGPIAEQVKFSTGKFIQQILEFKETALQEQASKKGGLKGVPLVILAVLPSYNHLKKAIFELKKCNEFNAACDIRNIITKVHARNFYMNKNRNTF
jgi:hypothetical protein